MARRERRPLVVSSLGACVYGLLAYLEHRQHIETWDVAIFTEAVKGYAHLSAPVIDVANPGLNQLGDHFSPIVAVLAPAYRLFPSTLTLQLAQVVLLCVSIHVVTRSSIRHLGGTAGTLVGAAYGLSFGLQSASAAGFHELAFAAPLLALVGENYLRCRYRAAALWCAPLLFVKEDLAVVVGVFGLCLFLRGARRLGVTLIVTAAASLVLVVGVVIPAFNPRGRYDYLTVASGPSGSLWQLLVDVPQHLVTPAVKPTTLALTLLLTGFLACRSPFLLLAAPIFVERFIAPSAYYWGPYGDSSLVVMVIVFVAAVEGITRTRTSPSAAWRGYALAAPTAMLAVAALLVPTFELGNLFSTGLWRKSGHAIAAERVKARIAPGSSVQSDASMSAYLAPDFDVFFVPFPDPHHLRVRREGAIGADYVVVDQRDWDSIHIDAVAYARSLNPTVAYDVIYRCDRRVLLRRSDL